MISRGLERGKAWRKVEIIIKLVFLLLKLRACCFFLYIFTYFIHFLLT